MDDMVFPHARLPFVRRVQIELIHGYWILTAVLSNCLYGDLDWDLLGLWPKIEICQSSNIGQKKNHECVFMSNGTLGPGSNCTSMWWLAASDGYTESKTHQSTFKTKPG